MAKTFIGNIKGPQGVPGPKGDEGVQGPRGPQGKTGPTAVSMDGAIQSDLVMSSARDALASKVFVQLKDTEGRLVMIEANYENVYLVNSDGDEVTLKDYVSLVSKCVSGCALFNVDFDVSLLTDLNKFAVTEIAAESEEQ